MPPPLMMSVMGLALSACASIPQPVRGPSPTPSHGSGHGHSQAKSALPATPLPRASAAPEVASWQDAKPAPGTWAYRSDPQWPVALFGQPGAQASFAVRCDRARNRVLLQRAAAQPFAIGATLTVKASTGERSYAAEVLSWAPAYLTATLAADDPQLDALAFSRGKFVVSISGQDPLILPSWAEFARIIEDCRG